MERVSVIIPVYNVEKYLRECVDSVLAQTYENIEVILVDDGSPDSCPAICDEYAAHDARVRVIHQENRGLSAARNAGLSIAVGAYVAFVDSDDVISPIMYEQLVTAIESENADMAVCEYARDIAGLDTREEPPESYHCFNSYDECLAMMTCAPSVRKITWTGVLVWNKLYRRELIKHKFNSECLIGEDLDFNLHYIRECKRAVLVPRALYMYRNNENSVMNTYNRAKNDAVTIARGISSVKVWEKVRRDAEHYAADTALVDYLRARAAYNSHGVLWRVYAAHLEGENADFVRDSRELIRSYAALIFRDRATYSLFIRIMCILCARAFVIWKLAARLYGTLHLSGHAKL